MNIIEEKYNRFALCGEMLETIDIFRNYDQKPAKMIAEIMPSEGPVLFTGEGSSRLFPAKRAVYQANRVGSHRKFFTEGSTQAMEYDLSGTSVFGASNSGKTKELINLFKKLKEEKHPALFGVTAGKETLLQSMSKKTRILDCGQENAVAATKSVAEQALFYQAVMSAVEGKTLSSLDRAADDLQTVLTSSPDKGIIEALADADTICFAGRNNGVAEELALKTNEITRKKSSYFEGTYAAHGVEEVLTDRDVLVIVDPFPEEEEKLASCLVEGVGMKVFAISDHPTLFPSFFIPGGGVYRNYLELAAGWNILVETGLALEINLDKPVRARKVGNEY